MFDWVFVISVFFEKVIRLSEVFMLLLLYERKYCGLLRLCLMVVGWKEKLFGLLSWYESVDCVFELGNELVMSVS